MRCTSSRSVSVVCLDYKVCTFHHLSNVCMRVPLYFVVCVGCANTPQGLTGGSDTTREPVLYERTWCVLSSMCHTMHSGYPCLMDTITLEDKNEVCCEEGVCSTKVFRVTSPVTMVTMFFYT